MTERDQSLRILRRPVGEPKRRHRELALAAVHPWEQLIPATRQRWLDEGWTGGWVQNELAQRVAQAIADAERRVLTIALLILVPLAIVALGTWALWATTPEIVCAPCACTAWSERAEEWTVLEGCGEMRGAP